MAVASILQGLGQVALRAKVKCIHEGQSPCRRCQRTNLSDCVLTDTYSSPARKSRRAALRTQNQRRVISEPTTTLNSPPSHASRDAQPPSLPPRSTSGLNPIVALPSSTIIAACETYRKKFPVANFLHYPSLIADLSANPSSVDPVFVAALLSLCARFMSTHQLDAAETYANYARKQLAHRALEAPSLYLAQSLVMITFYEWGSGRAYKAWMYSGMATYMIQSLLKTADDSMEHNPQEFHDCQTQYEQLVRTYWCCFAQDCELSSGARQHFALSFRQISVPLPISDHDFNFGRPSPRRLMPSDMSRHSPLSSNLTIDYGLTIVTRGFDIFVRILRFANESRRGRPSTIPADVSSPRLAWQKLKEELDEWRYLQDVTVRYPATSAQAHVALGYGELFAYINLVYFMSILFLYRDQFLSSLKLHTDVLQQLQQADGVDESQAIRQLFEAAQNIGSILSALEVSGAPVITPYSGFSIFVAAHINMYGTVCPQRYPGGRERAEREKTANLAYLEQLSEFWPVGQTWWRAVQEANRFYQLARDTQTHVREGGHLAIAGTLDEYGDIRGSRPRPEPPRRSQRETAATTATVQQPVVPGRTSGLTVRDQAPLQEFHDLETEMLQWPFIDESWSLGFDTGVDAAWPALGG
ncbi:transcription factor domain-containing protein [Aspergillus clavatus NRRL 1]|uniref:Fungal specific transcription factor domain protein n=1 Tax=Aspergillus clavatus (strain ATCC 1007 / CBS 513.65 / DSM 816 / NCTC 3887 / NRRL 1 / QM 1276 / 107) TaxID=344612 RepID=A1CDZ0_ASPCL|nr:fungal specific transcription factor domain protein [Aspergillus clavatus NRRL 1]EAW12067.1 fungal specific transcription factor domain protein [Aspergillus clavatus NRRL 1]